MKHTGVSSLPKATARVGLEPVTCESQVHFATHQLNMWSNVNLVVQ